MGLSRPGMLACRKTLVLILGTLLPTALGAILWPFITGPGETQEYCGALRVCTSPDAIREYATPRGLVSAVYAFNG